MAEATHYYHECSCGNITTADIRPGEEGRVVKYECPSCKKENDFTFSSSQTWPIQKTKTFGSKTVTKTPSASE